MDQEQPKYFSYLLRLWRESDKEMPHQIDESSDHTEKRPIWLASLQSSLTGQRKGFANLEDLFAFLRQQTGAVSDPEREETRTEVQ